MGSAVFRSWPNWAQLCSDSSPSNARAFFVAQVTGIEPAFSEDWLRWKNPPNVDVAELSSVYFFGQEPFVQLRSFLFLPESWQNSAFAVWFQ